MLHGFQDIVFWCVLHKEEVVLDAGMIAMVGMVFAIAVFSSAEPVQSE